MSLAQVNIQPFMNPSSPRPALLRLLLPLSILLLLPAQETRGAPRKAVLRVMTYNIHVGVGTDKKLNLARVAEVIKREGPDLVGLQEVDRGVERTKRVDQIAELARLTRMEYAFAFNLRYQGGQYGVAVLSKFPILSIDHRRYKHLREAERRGFLRVEISVGGRTVNFVTTHLDYRDADNRLYETGQLIAALDRVTTPLIVLGDFNDEPDGASYGLMLQRFADAWLPAGAGAGLTYPADKPVKRIDYIFHNSALRARRSWIPPTEASDHLPLVADLEFIDDREPRPR